MKIENRYRNEKKSRNKLMKIMNEWKKKKSQGILTKSEREQKKAEKNKKYLSLSSFSSKFKKKLVNEAMIIIVD